MEGSIALRPHVGANPWRSQSVIERLTELHGKKLSFAAIAAMLSAEFNVNVTRNSCIGKASRIGLDARVRERGPSTPRPRSRPSVARVVPATVAEPFKERLAKVEPLHISLIDLQHGQCRYPYGDGPFTFCGCPAMPARPYCEPHQQLCTAQPTSEADRRAAAQQRRAAFAKSVKEAA